MNLFDDPKFWYGENDRKWSKHPDTVNRAINCMRESKWQKLTELFTFEPSNEDVITLIKETNKYLKFDDHVTVQMGDNLFLTIWRE